MKAIYIRTSTTEQNPQNQLKDCESLINGDYRLFEEKESAFKDKDRPIFESIKKEIQNKKVNHLICWDLDRLFRNRSKLIEFFQFCKVYDCKISSFRQQWLNDLNKIPQPFDEIMHSLMLQIMGWLGEEESKKKSDRVKIAHKNHKGSNWGRPSLNLTTGQEIIQKFGEGLSLREISKQVTYWDKNNHKKNVSLASVHKTIKEFKQENDSKTAVHKSNH